MKVPILGMNKKELRHAMQIHNFPEYRGDQIADWLYRKEVHSFNEMLNLPADLRLWLDQNYSIVKSKIVKIRKSSDGTIKLLLELGGGARIETVGIPFKKRYSCCVSTQVGCAVGCVFCATGQSGFKRNMSAGEIVDQVLTMIEVLRGDTELNDITHLIDNIVFMGMGEPLLNYDETIKSVNLMNNELGIGARHITISTVGYLPGINRLAGESLQITLALSLHAPTDELRKSLIPGMRKWKLHDIIKGCKDYLSTTNRRVTFEYCLIENVNDSEIQAEKLSRLLFGFNCHVNVIPFNSVSGIPFRKPSKPAIERFIKILTDSGINTTQRVQRGADIEAACGQLRQQVGNK